MGSHAIQFRLRNIQRVNLDLSPDDALNFLFTELHVGARDVHVLPVVDIEIRRHQSDRLTNDQFVRELCGLLERFGFFKLGPHGTKRPGFVTAHVIGPKCALLIASYVAAMFRESIETVLSIPPRLIHPALLNHPPVHREIEIWLRRYRWPLRHADNRWFGTRDAVQEITELMRDQQTPVKLKYIAIPLTCAVTVAIRAQLQNFRHRGWVLNEQHRVIVAPGSDLADVHAFLEKQVGAKKQDALGCIMFCDDPQLSPLPITVYNKNAKHQTAPLCMDCMKTSLQEFTQSFFQNEVMDYDKLALLADAVPGIPVVDAKFEEDAYWPQIPMGQLLFVLLSEPTVASLAKAWVSGVLTNTLRSNPAYFTFCPDHPHAIILLPTTAERDRYLQCKVPKCKNVYCGRCFKWHDPADMANCEKNQYKGPRCPHCKVPSVKESGCNHITCPRCQKHWCYACNFCADTSEQVYAHMNAAGHM
jgi:hypothetical protein